MDGWEKKIISIQDWVTIIFLACFFIISILKYVNSINFNYLINSNYSKIYKKNPLNNYNILASLVIIIIFSFHLFFIFRNYGIIDDQLNNLFYIIFTISFIILIRTLTFILFIKISKYEKVLKNLMNGNLNIFFRSSLILFLLMTFNLYALSLNHIFNILISISIFINLFYSQFSLFWNTYKEFKPSIYLLILYICALKISPWIIICSIVFI